jgi:glycolate oxidase FAD binding subunit
MTGAPAFKPARAEEIADFLADRTEAGAPVLIRGGGSKDALGRPSPNGAESLDLSGLAGITLYEPEELVLTARAGTSLAEIEAAIGEHGQCLAFEPPDFGPLLGATGSAPTLGGVVAAGLSGPRRIKAGAARDHVLGAQAFGGDGRAFKSGGRVVKNVTGFDLPKLLTGSHGTLAAMTEITVKILPAPEISRTLLLLGLEAPEAIRALTAALGGPNEVSGAAHLPPPAAARSSVAKVAQAGGAVTALRLEGFGPSVADRLVTLEARFRGAHGIVLLDPEECRSLWREIRDVSTLIDHNRIVWRLSLPPTEAASVVAAIGRSLTTEALYDWAGGLVWLVLPPAEHAHAPLVRDILPSGHATLVRAPASVRAAVPVFQPQPEALAQLTRRVKAAFDPCGILGRGRMYSHL